MDKKKESVQPLTSVSIDASYLAGVLKPIAVMNVDAVGIGIGDNTLELEAETRDGKRFQQSIEIQTVGKKAKYTVPLKVLMKTLKALSGDVTISFSFDQKVTLSQGEKRSFSLAGMDPVVLSKVGMSDTSFVVRASVLRKLLTKAARFTSKDEFREHLVGVHLKVASDGIQVTASDGVVLSLQKYQIPIAVEKEISVVLPVEVARVLDAISTVEFHVDCCANSARFAFGGGVFETTVIDALFPDVSAIMENARSCQTHAVFGRQDLDLWLRLNKVFTCAGLTPQMVLYVDSGKVMARTEDPSFQAEALTWKAETNGELTEPYLLKVDAERLATIISALDDDVFVVGMEDNARASAKEPSGVMLWQDAAKREDVRHEVVFMPIRIDESEKLPLLELFQSKEVCDVAAIED